MVICDCYKMKLFRWHFARFLRQTKDQNKKGPGIKLGPQMDKKGPGNILQDQRKDNPMDNPKVCVLFIPVNGWWMMSLYFLRKTKGFLIIFFISQMEELMNVLEKTRQELDATKQRLSSTQQSLAERDGHLTNLRQERRKQLEEILEMK